MQIKRFLPVIFFVFFIPQFALAAWWNPLDWFNGWSFLRGTDNAQTQILENRVKELESRLKTEDQSEKTSVLPKEQALAPQVVSSPKKTPASASSLTSQEALEILNAWKSSFEKSIIVRDSNIKYVTDSMNNLVALMTAKDYIAREILIEATLDYVVVAQQQKKELREKNDEVIKGIQQVNSQGYLDGAVWSDAKFTEFQAFYSRLGTETTVMMSNYKNKLRLMLAELESVRQGESADFASVESQKPSVNECSDVQGKYEAQIRAEIAAAGGTGTNSQVSAMALARMKEAGMASCFAGGGVSGGYSTQCNSLNGGFDCTSSNGMRTYVNPIPGTNSFSISSYQ